MVSRRGGTVLLLFLLFVTATGGASAKTPVSQVDVGCVKGLGFTSEGELAVGVVLGVRFFEVPTFREVRSIRAQTGFVNCMALSPDGALLALGSEKNVELWNVATGELLRVLRGHTNWVRSVTFAPDGAFLASGSDDTTVRLWEVATGNLIRTLEGHSNWVVALDFTPMGSFSFPAASIQRQYSGTGRKGTRCLSSLTMPE
jgi:WD40 repeat protein